MDKWYTTLEIPEVEELDRGRIDLEEECKRAMGLEDGRFGDDTFVDLVVVEQSVERRKIKVVYLDHG